MESLIQPDMDNAARYSLALWQVVAQTSDIAKSVGWIWNCRISSPTSTFTLLALAFSALTSVYIYLPRVIPVYEGPSGMIDAEYRQFINHRNTAL
jgi:hypothetical protein